MEQMTKAEIHSELCNKMQSAKDTYCRNTCTAPEIDIDRMIKYKRKQSVKKVSRIAAVVLVFIITSVFFAQEFFSDNGYGKYIVQKSVSSMSPLDITTERLGSGEPLSVVHIDDEVQLDKFNEFMGRELVLGYMPEGYEFDYCEGEKGDNILTLFYKYKAQSSYMEFLITDNGHSSKVYIRGKLVKTLDNGNEIFGEQYDDGRFTVTKIIDDDIFVVMDSNGDYNEAIKVAENVSVE